MLRNLKNMAGLTIQALDGNIGSIDEFYFDDEKWTIRYIIVNTGGWLMGRRVLISPVSVRNIDWSAKTLSVHLTMDQVEASPDIDTEKPVSRQQEEALSQHYGWIPYWNFGSYSGPPGFGTGMLYPGVPYPENEQLEGVPATVSDRRNATLRSTSDVMGYHVEAGHGRIGHIDDLIFDDESWTIRYFVIDTREWLRGKKVLIAPIWVNRIRWPNRAVQVDLDRKTIEGSPAYDSSRPITREDEEKISDYYCRVGSRELTGISKKR